MFTKIAFSPDMPERLELDKLAPVKSAFCNQAAHKLALLKSALVKLNIEIMLFVHQHWIS